MLLLVVVVVDDDVDGMDIEGACEGDIGVSYMFVLIVVGEVYVRSGGILNWLFWVAEAFVFGSVLFVIELMNVGHGNCEMMTTLDNMLLINLVYICCV